MNRVFAKSERVIRATLEEVYTTLIDYQNKRPSILTPNTEPLEGRAIGVYVRTTTLGFVAGLRSMMPLAVLNWTSDRTQSGTASAALLLTTLAALGEVVADKLPVVPSRTSPGPLTGRLVIGGLVGMVLCRRAHLPPVLGIVTGAMGAAAGTFAGNYSRTRLSQATKIPDLLWGGLEDMLALGLSLLAA
jgi:uncharacterized membrane protein